jgi:amino acid adenylation domain-containing protein
MNINRSRSIAHHIPDQAAYWRRVLSDSPATLKLPFDFSRPPVQTFIRNSDTIVIDQALFTKLKELSAAQGVTLFTSLLAIFGVLLMRFSRQENVVVGSLSVDSLWHDDGAAKREFVNPIALRCDLSGHPTSTHIFQRVAKTIEAAAAHRDYPFDQLAKDLGMSSALNYSPIFQVMLVVCDPLLGLSERPCSSPDLHAARSHLARCDLVLVASEENQTLRLHCQYDADLFHAQTIRRVLDHLRLLIGSVIAAPEQTISALPMLTPAERHELLVEKDATAADGWHNQTLHRLFEAQVARTPDAIALTFEEAAVSYAQLNAQSNRLAHDLTAQGVVAGRPVALMLPTSPLQIAALLAVLKTGCCFVYLDPDYPTERLRLILEEVGPPLLLADANALAKHENLAQSLEASRTCRLLAIDPSRGAFAGLETHPTADLNVKVEPNALAYIVYTSGSTGRPKGIMQSHGSFAQFTAWFGAYFGFGSRSRIVQWASITYDASYCEIFGALCFGARLCLAPRSTRHDPLLLLRWATTEAISVLQVVPSFARQLLRIIEEQDACEHPFPSLAQLLLAGEVLSPTFARAWLRRFPDYPKLFNLYGPTECVLATYYPVEQVESEQRSIPVGRAIDGRHILILDQQGQLCPIGAVGEIYVRSPFLTNGYFQRPELTAEKFVPDPFATTNDQRPTTNKDKVTRGQGDKESRQSPISNLTTNDERRTTNDELETQHSTLNTQHSRLYKTGDLGQWLSNGEVEFLGRADNLVKLRGMRVELEEIEAILSSHEAVREAVLILHDRGADEAGADSKAQLVAYIVLRRQYARSTDTHDAIKSFKSYLGSRLPEYMVPSAFVFLEKLPLTPNSKVDRKALPAPDLTARQERFVAARTPTEQILTGIWAEVLGLDHVGVHDNFFALGGHSLLATQVISRVRTTFQIELSFRTLFKMPKVASLAKWIERARSTGPYLTPIERVSRDGRLPLSFAQQRLWILDRLSPNNSAYNILAFTRLRGLLNIAALERSLNEIVRRHEALRTCFKVVQEQPVQVIAPDLALPMPLVDFTHVPSYEREAAARGCAEREALRCFDLACGPLMRVSLLRLSDREHILLLVVHHIVSDEWSMGILLKELAALYEAFSLGLPSPLPELPIQYADFAYWQCQWLSGEVLKQQLGYWKQQLENSPPILDLPTDHPRSAVRQLRGASYCFELPAPLTESLRALSCRENATLFMTLLAAFKALLYRYTGQEDIVVGSPIANRNRSEVEPLIGFFVNMLALRTQLSGAMTFRDLLAHVRETCLGAYAHQDLPFEKLVAELRPERSSSHTPLFQVLFVLQNASRGELELPGIASSPYRVNFSTAKFDLHLACTEVDDRLAGILEYNTGLFKAGTVERLVAQLQRLLESITADPDLALMNYTTTAETTKIESEIRRLFKVDQDVEIAFGR